MAYAELRPLFIAHQLPEAFQQLVGNALPPGTVVQALPPEAAWEVPPEADILLAVPPRGGNVAVSAEKPPGWPGKLRWLHAISAGVDEYPPWIFEVPIVTCGRGTNSGAIAEFVLASLLAVEKRLPESWISSPGAWQSGPELGTLQGKTLGLLGFGSIGQAIAARAAPFGVNILAFRFSAGGDYPGVTFANLDAVLAAADHLVIALPLTAATSGLIGPAAFVRLKPGAHVVNIARGRIIDQDALLAALDSGQVGFASLDVTEPEPLPLGHRLYGHPRVHLSPHIAWSSGGGRAIAAALFTENLRRFLAGAALENIVPPERGY